MTRSFALPTIIALLTTAACSSSSSSEPAAPPPVAAAPTTPAEVAAPAPAPEPEVQMADYDLSSADSRWAGWTATAPAGAQVMQDGVHGARIAANGLDGFDLAFTPSHQNLSRLRHNVEAGAAASNGEVTLSFTESTDDRLVWTVQAYGTTSYNFVMNYEVDGRDVSCSNNIMMGISSEERMHQHQEACQTLRHGAAQGS